MTPLEIFYGNDGQATTALYESLRARGPIGHCAECLYRACKKSMKAKTYRRRYRTMSYEDKTSSMSQVVKILEKHGADLGFRWGWKVDPKVVFGDEASFVLYVDIPWITEITVSNDGSLPAFSKITYQQVSYHSPTRGEGPDYDGEWDGIRGVSEQRVIAFATYVLTLPVIEMLEPVFPFGKFRGQPVSDAETHYIQWYEENVRNITPEFRASLNHELNRRQGSGAGRIVTPARNA